MASSSCIKSSILATPGTYSVDFADFAAQFPIWVVNCGLPHSIVNIFRQGFKHINHFMLNYGFPSRLLWLSILKPRFSKLTKGRCL